MNKPRVFADFHNADVKGRLRLSCVGTIEDLERHGIVLREGQSLIIYSEELEVEGVVHYSEEEKLWTAVIDWDAIREVEPIVPQPAIQAISPVIEPKWANGGYITALEINTM
ncbi:hypothetical protein F4X90_00510 [Candidatus Poribacteria bacterium]|nr:hypothetical protein [Candidatus Poribacteria bacterium]